MKVEELGLLVLRSAVLKGVRAGSGIEVPSLAGGGLRDGMFAWLGFTVFGRFVGLSMIPAGEGCVCCVVLNQC